MNSILIALDLLIQLTAQVQRVGTLIRNAQAEGRDLTAAELDELRAEDDAARKALQDAIDARG